MRHIISLFAFVLMVAGGAITNAADWGDLTAKFILDGPVEAPPEINVTKDAEFCGKFGLVDESLVVNKENNGIANVIVYMYLRSGTPPIHESYAKTADAKVMLDNLKCRYEPHVVLLRTSQTLTIGNKDTVGHNSKIDTFSNPPTNFTIPPGASLDQQFTESERLPTGVSCAIHPWMKAWVVIKDNPYMGVSDKDGKLEIKNVPAGKWTFQFWQEKSGYVDTVKVNGTPTEWTRGRLEVDIKPGKNDLGEIKIAPEAFVD